MRSRPWSRRAVAEAPPVTDSFDLELALQGRPSAMKSVVPRGSCQSDGKRMTDAEFRAPAIEIRRSGHRVDGKNHGFDSQFSRCRRESDPTDAPFGLLLVQNQIIIGPGTGFDVHPHRDVEIVTWVLSGTLAHQDSRGRKGVIYRGLARRVSAGSGILHSEKNDAWRLTGDPRHEDPVHFVQMFVVSDDYGMEPSYDQFDIEAELLRGGLVPIASGRSGHRGHAAVRINQKDATLYAARMNLASTVVLPEAEFVHLFVACGSVTLEGCGMLMGGDAAAICGSGGQTVSAVEDAEILVWEMHSSIGETY